MKSYTDLKQSKKLAEFLPLESADIILTLEENSELTSYPIMRNYSEFYNYLRTFELEEEYIKHMYIPVWSLAALLSLLPFQLIVDNKRYAFSMIKGLDKNGETYAIKYAIFNTTFYFHLTDFYNNPVDACVEMIKKLHELKLL